MKKLFILVLVSIAFMANGQDSKEKLIGNWWYCGSAGYSEFIISDSVFQVNSLGFGSVIYKCKVGVSSISLDNTEWTIHFTFVEDNTLELIYFGNKFYCERIEEDINIWGDYSCEMEVSKSQYQEVLEQEFKVRALKKTYDCPKKVDFEILEDLGVLSNFNEFELNNGITKEGLEASNIEVLSYELEEYYFVKKNIDKPFKATLYSIDYNEDSTKAIVNIDYGGRCYDNYNQSPVVVWNKKKGSIDFQMRYRKSECSELCHIRFVFLLVLEDCEFEEVKINIEEYKLKE